MKRIAVFASGSGSNAEKIITYFQDKPIADVSLVVYNKPDAFVLERAKKLSVPTLLINKDDLYESDEVINQLKDQQIDLIVLAGFLWLIPKKLIKAFPEKIINIHPALLPRFGGKGMYGLRVHQAVKEANDTETGITIHYVNEVYDAGTIIRQERVAVSEEDTPTTIAQKVQQLEHQYYPEVIESILQK
ncbi:MAG: phosphoribosylglycinamide formyltransferase [Thermonemataceae bacterium]